MKNASLPSTCTNSSSVSASHFLERCYLCRRRLQQGNDIYIVLQRGVPMPADIYGRGEREEGQLLPRRRAPSGARPAEGGGQKRTGHSRWFRVLALVRRFFEEGPGFEESREFGVLSKLPSGYAAAAAAAPGVRRSVEQKTAARKVVDSSSTAASSSASSNSWVPDPVTGYYRPGNLRAQVDAAELREMNLSRKQ
ncbi:hypothetical protein GW17_00000008 [Ensete ventricosum]|nr:hypothetical protein GW17_00000008 [Ensete ventricosum]